MLQDNLRNPTLFATNQGISQSAYTIFLRHRVTQLVQTEFIFSLETSFWIGKKWRLESWKCWAILGSQVEEKGRKAPYRKPNTK